MLDFTTASREQLKRCYDAIAKELNDDRFFTTKELDVLPKILSPLEQVLSFSSGLMDGSTWLIVLTDQRVLFVDKGMIYGLKQTSIDLGNIVVIDAQTHLVFGSISISTAAGPREIRNTWKSSVNIFVNKVRAAQAASRRGDRLVSPGTEDQPEPSPSPSPAPVHHAAPDPWRDIAPATAPAPAPTPAPAPVQQTQAPQFDRQVGMARLERLRNAGSISEDDYQRQRSQIG